jgi:nicotinamidase-related amidase
MLSPSPRQAVSTIAAAILATQTALMAADDGTFDLVLRRRVADTTAPDGDRVLTSPASWSAAETAMIVCDVWDEHHSRNAVRRLEAFAPRLDAVVAEARRRGATIIHAPSDCMDAYEGHPARARAVAAPPAADLPPGITAWCSALSAEMSVTYPIDQSDGGADDDPDTQAAWQTRLAGLGRDPGIPWARQSPLITIDPEADFISDRGDEVWNILAARGIRHVILAGVHVNMCVLGRPFGLRQLARHGREVVLMRDMTDAMYNPARWPYVSHVEGTRRVIAHIERTVCPTITSDQVLGGEPFRFDDDGADAAASDSAPRGPEWVTTPWGGTPGWYRCTLFLPATRVVHEPVLVADPAVAAAWLNGRPLDRDARGRFRLDRGSIVVDDVNLLVVKLAGPRAAGESPAVAPRLEADGEGFPLANRWQWRPADGDRAATPWTMPLPAKFGGPPDILFTLPTTAAASPEIQR